MPEFNMHEFIERKLDMEAKLFPADIEATERDFNIVLGILKSSANDINRIHAFNLLSAEYKNKKVPGFADIPLGRQRFLTEIALQTARFAAAYKARSWTAPIVMKSRMTRVRT